MPDLHGRLTPQGNLDGTLHTIVYANNYNSLDNKPSINSVTLQGNKTASELGLAVPADITVTSVNGETGAVVLDGTDINYDANTTVNSKLDDLQSQIDNSGVLAVNGKTGVVTLTGSDINYSAGVTLNSKIDAVEAEIPTVNYPVTSVNTKTGAVVLDGTDIKYDTNTTINAKIDAVEAEIPTVDYPVTSVNGETGTVVLDGTDINYDTNTTINAKIDAVQGNIPTTDNDISHYTGTPTAGSTAEAIRAHTDISDKFVVNADISGLSGGALVYYNSALKRVWGTIWAYSNVDLATNDAIFIINSAYRPSATIEIPMVIRTSNAATTYKGTIRADGEIRQSAGSIGRGIYAYIEYYL